MQNRCGVAEKLAVLFFWIRGVLLYFFQCCFISQIHDERVTSISFLPKHKNILEISGI